MPGILATQGLIVELLFHWIRYTLILWGLAYIVTQSAIMLPFRRLMLRMNVVLGVLAFCPACSGFWLGAGLGAVGIYGPALAPLSSAWIESALISTILGYLWGTYYGDPHGFERAAHELTVNSASDEANG
jgi:hypothetical protein